MVSPTIRTAVLPLLPFFFAPLVVGCPAKTTNPAVRNASPQASVTPAPARSPAPLEVVKTPANTFFTLPYIQLGENSTDASTLAIVWHLAASAASADGWSVETRSPAGLGEWRKQSGALQNNPVALGAIAPHAVVTAPIRDLTPGAPFDYRIVKNGTPVFSARVNRARPSADQSFRMVVFGDCAEDTLWQKKVAYQASLLKPDSVMITGDIVYPHGRASEYRDHYFPIYNTETPAPNKGASLLRSTLFIGVSGNHDLDYANFGRYPDGLAYYYYWKQPLNGWGTEKGNRPPVKGSTTAFEKAAGKEFPNGANYTFDYGNVHFVVIDSNYYMNWRDPKMIAELKRAIQENPKATWRFVVFHVPPFHASSSHQNEQWMRTLPPVLEECGVDVVWSGHVHNYQRTYPLKFVPTGDVQPSGKVDGSFTLDTAFDGTTATKPNGIIYVVTGAGGAALYPKLDAASEKENFIAKYIASTHSFTEMSVQGKTLSVRQIDENGKEIDKWSVTK